MKGKHFLALSLSLLCVMALSACGAKQSGDPSASPSPTSVIPTAFGSEDLTIAGLTINQTTYEEAKAALGSGYDEEKYTLGEDESEWISLSSDAAIFSFVKTNGKYILTHINITDASISGPRGTHVGDSAESVMAKYLKNDPILTEDDTKVLYRANPDTTTGISVPPCGLWEEDAISYYFPAAPYAFNVSDDTEVGEKYDLLYDVNYGIAYQLDNGVVTAIFLRYGADGE